MTLNPLLLIQQSYNLDETSSWIVIILMSFFIGFVIYGLYLIVQKIKKFFLFLSVRNNAYVARTFLTNNEKDCFRHLKKIFPEYHICPQVSMGATLEPNIKGKNLTEKQRSQYTVLRNQIQAKVIDYVMLNSQLEVEFVVELDDRSHDVKQDKDALRDKNMLGAGIPTVRFRRVNGHFISRDDILKQVQSQKR